MAMGKNAARINFVGGGTLWLNTDLEEATKPTPAVPGTWVDTGYLAEEGTDFVDNEEVEDVRDETGTVVKSRRNNRSVQITAKLMQTGKDEVDFINTNRLVPLQAYYTVITEDGATEQQWHFPKVELVPQIELTFGNALRILNVLMNVVKADSETDYYTITEVAIP